MNKTANQLNRVNKVINMIMKQGKTWEEVAELLQFSVGYLHKVVKDHYKRESSYNKLLAKARANKKAQAEAKSLLKDEEATSPTPEKEKEVAILETGYLLERGIPENVGDMYIPKFCLREVSNLRFNYAKATQILQRIQEEKDITPINLRGQEILFCEPSYPVKNRTVGIVALACYLWSNGYKVKIFTTSREVEKVAMIQGFQLEIIRIEVYY